MAAKQACIGAPYVIKQADLDRPKASARLPMLVQYKRIRGKQPLIINDVGDMHHVTTSGEPAIGRSCIAQTVRSG